MERAAAAQTVMHSFAFSSFSWRFLILLLQEAVKVEPEIAVTQTETPTQPQTQSPAQTQPQTPAKTQAQSASPPAPTEAHDHEQQAQPQTEPIQVPRSLDDAQTQPQSQTQPQAQPHVQMASEFEQTNPPDSTNHFAFPLGTLAWTLAGSKWRYVNTLNYTPPRAQQHLNIGQFAAVRCRTRSSANPELEGRVGLVAVTKRSRHGYDVEIVVVHDGHAAGAKPSELIRISNTPALSTADAQAVLDTACQWAIDNHVTAAHKRGMQRRAAAALLVTSTALRAGCDQMSGCVCIS